MTILHVIHRYPPAIGGGEFWCAGLAAWQAARGHDVRVLTLRALTDDELWGPRVWSPDDATTPPAGPIALGRFDRRNGVAIRRCAVDRPMYAVGRTLARFGLDSLSWGYSAEMYGSLVRAARAADVVHAYWLSGPHAAASYVAARLARRRFVLTPFFHAGFEPHESSGARWLLARADRIVALTDAEVAGLTARGVPRERVVLGGNAIAPPPPAPDARDRVRAALGVDRAAPLLCYVGRKAPNKGLDVLLATLARMDDPPWLAIAGPATAWYRELLAQAGHGHVVDVPTLGEAAKADLLAAADLLVLPSRFESFGSVFLEAWAAGTAVVGADVSAVREVVGDAGFLFRPDDADDLARVLASALSDAAARAEAVRRGAIRVAEHSWDRVGPRVMAAYAYDGGGHVS